MHLSGLCVQMIYSGVQNKNRKNEFGFFGLISIFVYGLNYKP